MFSYNTTPHSATNYTPHELLFGFKPELPISINRPPEIIYTYDDFVSEIKFELQYSHQNAKENIRKSKTKGKKIFDKKSKSEMFYVGDKILLNNKASSKGRSKKQESLGVGPFKVVQ